MPGLLLDDGTFHLLAVPSRTTIGRGASNDIQPESQSISKSHGALEIAQRRGRLVTTIEDFDSRNGTFSGPDTLEMERVKGKREIQFGYYLRFGTGGKFFRYLEEPPRDAIIVDPNEPAASIPSRNYNSNPARSESPAARNGQQQLSSSLAIDVPDAGPESRLVRSMPDFSSPAGQGQYDAAEHLRYASLPPPQVMPWQQAQQQQEDNNMTISIQYPTAGRQPLQPVTISIDPAQRTSYNNNQQQQQPSHYQQQAPSQALVPHTRPSSAQMNRTIEELLPDERPRSRSLEPVAVGGWGEVRDSRAYDAEGHRLPPPLGASEWDPPISVAKNAALPPLHPGGMSKDGRPPYHRGQSPPRSLSPSRPSNANANTYTGAKIVSDKPLAKLVRRLWLPIDGLPMTTLVDDVLQRLIGPPEELSPRTKPDTPLPQMPTVPEFLLAEVAADRFHESEASVPGVLGGVVADLSDFFRQAVAGAQLVQDGPVSADLDSALLGVVSSILGDSIDALRSVCYGSVVQAFQDAQETQEECENNLKSMLEASLVRLERLKLFINKEFCADICADMTTAEMYCIAAVSLDFILSDLDTANALVWGLGAKLDAAGIAAATAAADAPARGPSPSRGLGASIESSSGGGVKTALSCELDELRRLKSKAGSRGANSAMAAQIALLEQERLSQELASGKPSKAKKNAKMQGAMDRLQQQELGAGHRDKRLHCVLRLCDDSLSRWQAYGLHKWHGIVAAIKSNYSSKLKRFARLLLVRKLALMGKFFRRWDKTSALLRTDLLIEQETAKLKYEMCGMEARIHELSSGNALAASLAAERALNKELAGTNMELRLALTELDGKLLDIANAPPASRKGLVRDVFYGREDEIAHSRREAKALKDELQRLYDLGVEAVAEKASQRILPRAPVPPEYRDKQERAPLPLRDRADRADRAAQATSSGGSPPRSLSPTDRRPPPLALLQKGPRDNELPTMKKGGYPPPVMTKVLTRADATMVIAQEVRRLSSTVTALQEDREELRIKSVTDSHANAQQSLAIQALQRRITDRERSQAALRALLKQRIGDKGLMELTVSLEEMGVGNSALLKEVQVPAEPQSQGSGYGGSAGKERPGLGFLPEMPRGRGNFRALIDEGLAYAPSDDESGGE